MKISITKFFLAFFIAVSCGFVMTAAHAYRVYTTYYYSQEPVYYVHHHHHYQRGYVCQTSPGYWKHGYWHSAHNVCWYR